MSADAHGQSTSSSSSSAGAKSAKNGKSSSNGGANRSAGSFIESEVRAGNADSRKYYVASFPSAGKDPIKGEAPLYPPFGSKSWPTPVHLKQEEVEQRLSDNDLSEDDEAEQGGGARRPAFKKRRTYQVVKDTMWVLSDKKRAQVLYGEVEGQTARYFCVVPPAEGGADQPFRVLPVHEWLEFKPPLPYKPMSSSEAKKLVESQSSMAKIMGFMEARQRKRDAEMEAEGAIEGTRGAAGAAGRSKQRAALGEDYADVDVEAAGGDLLHDEDDKDTKADAKKTKGRKTKLEDDEGDSAEENDDIDVMAIDRKGHGRGEGNGDADFQEEFHDDEDDGGKLKEEEDAVANEGELIQGAEEVAGAVSDEDEDSDDDDDDDDDDDEVNDQVEELLESRKGKKLDEDEDEFVSANLLPKSRTTKVVREPDGDELMRDAQPGGAEAVAESGAAGVEGGAGDGASPELLPKRPKKQPAPEAKTPQELFRNQVIDAVRQSGGVMEAKELYKQAVDKKALKTIGLEREQAKTLLHTIMKECFEISDDKITGTMVASLKQQFV